MTEPKSESESSSRHGLERWGLRWIYGCWLIAGGVWGWFWVALSRTMHAGMAENQIMTDAKVASVFCMPWVVVALCTIRWKRNLMVVVGILFASIVLAEAWAGYEEMKFKQMGEERQEEIMRSRWIFEDSWLRYDAETGEISGGD